MSDEERETVSTQEEQLPQEEVREADKEERQEELADIEDREYTPNVQKRINQLTAKWRSAERTIKEMESRGSEKDTILEEMRNHNERLYETIQRMATATETLVDVNTERVERREYEGELDKVKGQINELKQMRLKARTDLDWELDERIEEQIDGLKEKLYELKQKPKKEQQPDKYYNEDTDKNAIERWVNNTDWFSPMINGEVNTAYNPAMERAARLYDEKLVNSPEWNNRPIAERLKKVKDDIENKFGYSKKGTKVPVTEGVGMPPPKTESIQLTDVQKRTAHMFFPDMKPSEAEKLYASQIEMGGR